MLLRLFCEKNKVKIRLNFGGHHNNLGENYDDVGNSTRFHCTWLLVWTNSIFRGYYVSHNRDNNETTKTNRRHETRIGESEREIEMIENTDATTGAKL